MDDLTEYLIQAKIKEIGFDYRNEEDCLKAIRRSGWTISFIENPSEKVINIAKKLGVRKFNHTNENLMELMKTYKQCIRHINISKLTEEEKEILMYLV